jgi:Zn-dependent M28 family amino/carboxypeptidase
MDYLDAAGLAERIRTISSDEFEGRGPASEGERVTIAYLQDAFEGLGLEPANGDSWLQEVPLVAITAGSDMVLRVTGEDGAAELGFQTDFMAWTKRVIDRVELVDSEMVFVGYGVVAPEYGRDDYEGIDAQGKTVVMLVNDPGFATEDPDVFNGRSMTYYGRWTYKYEEAARQGAAGVLVVHETEPAGYPWEVVSIGWSGPQFGLVAEDANLSRAAVEGWLTVDAARGLFEQAGLDFDEAKAQAASSDFQAVPMGLQASLTIENDIERSTTNNVLATLPGSERPDEFVVYMAHWDHLGLDDSLEGDQIYNGALDNATGTAGLIELAAAFASMEEAPARSLLFLAVAAEEQGLLGSEFYASNPVIPLDKTVAAINMDGLNIFGPMRDITVVGWGNSGLDDYVEEEAGRQDRFVRPDPEPEKGFFYRSDHFSFAKQGVPALYTDAGIDHVEHGEVWGREQRENYTAERYHKPSDEFDESWDLTGAIDDLRLLFRIGYRLSAEAVWPNWREGNEFRALRDATMGDG